MEHMDAGYKHTGIRKALQIQCAEENDHSFSIHTCVDLRLEPILMILTLLSDVCTEK